MSVAQAVRSFNAGELSPLLHSRTDSDKYYSGCRIMENMIPLPYGAAMGRQGTEYLGAAEHANTRCRLIPFVFSTEQAYVIEMGEGYLRFWHARSGDPVLETSATAWTANDGGSPAIATSYLRGEYVTHSGTTYICLVSHTTDGTAGSFATDLAAGKWRAQTVSEVFTPYAEIDLRAVQFVQINDFIYFTHPGYPPQRLVRNQYRPPVYAAGTFQADWTFAETEYDWPPLLDENLDASLTLTPSGTTGSITLTDNVLAGPGVFNTQHVGAYFQLAWARASSTISKTFAANGSSSTIKVFGGWSLTTYGTWGGTLTVDRSYDGGSTWAQIRSYTSASDRNVTAAGNERKEALLRLTLASRTAGGSGDYGLLSVDSPYDVGLVRITAVGGSTSWIQSIKVTNGGSAYTSTPPTVTFSGGGGSGAAGVAVMYPVVVDLFGVPTTVYRVAAVVITNRGSGYTSAPTVTFSAPPYPPGPYVFAATATATIISSDNVATAEVINDLASTSATSFWSEGAWSEYQGYPRSITVHEGRVVYGGTAMRPQSEWGSRIDDFQNFRLGTLADDAFFVTAFSRTTNHVQWMASKDGVLSVGKANAEGLLSSGSQADTLSATSIAWKDTTKFGSDFLAPVELNDSLIFLQRQGRKVRSLVFDNDQQSYVAPDLTLLAEHVTRGGIVEWAAQQQPDSIVWAIRSDGVLLGMTLERDQDVSAWHRHTTAGDFESVCVVPGSDGDEVWLAVRREINGADVRYIERFRPDARAVIENEDKENWWHLDCAKRQTFDGETVIDGLEHLEGATVGVLADGASEGATYVVEGGEITLPTAANTVLVGLPFVPKVAPMLLHMDMRNGTSRGRKARIDRVVADVYKTLGGQYSTDGGKEWFDILYRDEEDEMDDSPAPFTGETQSFADGGFTDGGGDVMLRQDSPMPFILRAIIAKWSPSGD